MEEEIARAVEWWTMQLKVLHKGVYVEIDFPSERTLADFRRHLRSLLVARTEHHAKTIISTDYIPDETLIVALSKSGIDFPALRFPKKTIMWINPGEVMLSQGHGAPCVTIYRKNHGKNT